MSSNNQQKLKYLNSFHEFMFGFVHTYRIYRYNLFLSRSNTFFETIAIIIEITQRLIKGWNKKILFYPDFPFFDYQNHSLYQICLFKGYRITNNPFKKVTLAVKWEDYTFPGIPDVLEQLRQNKITVINIDCVDSSKSKVDEIFQDVFGYGLRLDPLHHQGKCVMKSELNAAHDGQIIECPIAEKKDNTIYQKLINNQVDKLQTLDYRIPVFAGQYIPFVYAKYLPLNKRFSGFSDLLSAKLIEVDSVFSEEEINKIIKFCTLMKVDHAELDILRDKDEQKIYIVDVNITSYSRLLANIPDRILKIEECSNAILKASDAFETAYIRRTP